MPPSKKQLAVVTGANRGIGFEVCRELGTLGYRILLTARNAAAAAEAADRLGSESIDASARVLDVSNDESVHAFTRELAEQGEAPIDALVNNAAIALDGFDADVAERTIATNFFGPLRVTDALLDRLSRGARIVMVSSGMGELSAFPLELRQQFDPPPSRSGLIDLVVSFVEAVRRGTSVEVGWPSSAYRVSKAGLNALTRIYARQLEPRGILVNAVCPGWVRTRMGGSKAPRSESAGARSVVWAATLQPGGPSGGFFRDGRPLAF